MKQAASFDVIVAGEVLVELAGPAPLRCGAVLGLGFAGDALNAAAAAAAAGARVGLLAVLGDDELGDAAIDRCRELGVETSLVRWRRRPNGVYFVVTDNLGAREFLYARRGSAGSTLSDRDVEAVAGTLRASRSLLVTGITGALSPGARGAVVAAAAIAAGAGGLVAYDPNYRSRLTSARAARRLFVEVARFATLVLPSAPAESLALLASADPEVAARRSLELGARHAVVSTGPGAVVLASPDGVIRIGVPPNPRFLDATGAGDVLAGTTIARLALGDTVLEATALGVSAAALSVAGRGGTGAIARLDEVRAHLARHADLVFPDGHSS